MFSHGSTNSNRPIRRSAWKPRGLWPALRRHPWEAILLAFADNPEFRRYAPLAFHRLHSPRSMKAMADLMTASSPGTFEQMEAAR